MNLSSSGAASQLERVVILLPAVVVGAGLWIGLVLILLGRALAVIDPGVGPSALDLGGLVALRPAAIVLLTYLGVELL